MAKVESMNFPETDIFFFRNFLKIRLDLWQHIEEFHGLCNRNSTYQQLDHIIFQRGKLLELCTILNPHESTCIFSIFSSFAYQLPEIRKFYFLAASLLPYQNYVCCLFYFKAKIGVSSLDGWLIDHQCKPKEETWQVRNHKF